jgi:hypothetical protein
MRRIAVITALVLVVLAGGLPAGAQVAEPNIRVTAQRPDSRLKTVTKRVIFSTAQADPRPDRIVRVRNIGDATLTVSSMTITGPNNTRFAVEDADAADGFTLAPHAFRDVPLSFTPLAMGFGRYAAQLETDSDDPGSPTTVTQLKGLHAQGYEEANEPTLFNILSTLGFEPHGLPNTNLSNPATSPNVIYEDEVRTTYFRPSKAHGRVALIPMARYSTVIDGNCCPAGWFERVQAKTKHKLQNWSDSLPPGSGENQKLMPVPGVPPNVNLNDNGDNRTVFTPGGDFGLYSGTDLSGNPERSMRFFHARRADRDNYYEDVWIVAEDQGTGASGPTTQRNFDHNDFVWLLVNAVPSAGT